MFTLLLLALVIACIFILFPAYFKQRKALISSLMLIPLLISCTNPAPEKMSIADIENSELYSQVQLVINNLDRAEFFPIRVGWAYDYGLKDGAGLLNTYEYIRSLITYETLQSILPMDIFIEGPHSKKQLELNSRFTFGHYNPEFVKYFSTVLSHLLSNQMFVDSTKGLMEEYGILDKLEKLQQIYYITDEEPEIFNKYKLQYQEMLNNKTWPADSYEGYRAHLPESLDTSYYWNWAETNYYFWIRRDIDGTLPLWISMIDSVTNAYKK